jgi:2-oxoglutarate-Fe(II)-dependent oxygenase superfamily protein
VAGDLDTPTAAPPDRFPMDQLLANRRWVRRVRPFPHVYARDVFRADFYRSLHEEFERIERDDPKTFERNMGGYDATGAPLIRFRHGPLGVFVSREWHDVIAAVAGVSATGDINAALHHHDPGSAGGWPHNDLNPSTFVGPPPGPDEVRLGGEGGVGVVSGDRPAGATVREVIRGVSLLFYLGNPDWSPGDGGETGLFTDYATWARGPARAVPPINNSMVMFECTPRTWHAFMSNRVKPRNSVVMWLHRAKDEVVERWGDENIAYWK